MNSSFDSMINDIPEKIARGLAKRKEYFADKKNDFRDGKFLASCERLNMVPAAS